MPIAKHVSLLIEQLNYPVITAYAETTNWSFKTSHIYDLLACMCDLNKYDFERIGFVASSLMPFVPAYQPYSEDLNDDLLNNIRQKIKEKLGFTEEQHRTLDTLVYRLTIYGFIIEKSIIRHPDQLIAMVRELYDSSTSILDHIDSLIELIDDLTYILNHKKNKSLQPVQYWLLHWCYATLFKHRIALEKQIIAENRIPSKSKALLSVYKSYFDDAYPAIQKYYQICLDLKLDQALSFDKKINNGFVSEYYETTHSFALVSQSENEDFEYFSSNGTDNLCYEKTTNLFYEITDKNYVEFEKTNSFIKALHYDLSHNLTREEEGVISYIQRLFRKDSVGYDLHYEDGGFVNEYIYLFSDAFLEESQESYKDLMPWSLKNIVETRANEIYSQMYRHYIKNRNFDAYSLPKITRTVEPLKF